MVTGAVVQEPVRAAIWYALNNYNFEDAVFLAERLHAEESQMMLFGALLLEKKAVLQELKQHSSSRIGTLDSVFLLATCYFRSGRVQQAKHLLGRHRESNDAKCDLLYSQCCLQLHDFKSGLLALHGLLCLGESSERDIALHFGEDAGVAFWLLGEFNRLLHQNKEAIRHFRSCLKHNPFLWTAYQALCELGESVSPEQCFTMSEFPPFLKYPAPHDCTSSHFPLSSYPPSSPSSNETKPSFLGNGLDANSKRPSAFTPVDSSKTGYVTPDLFGNPTLGKAVASSTPAPRTLQFTTSDFRGTKFEMGGSHCDPAGGGAAAGLKKGAPSGRIQFGSVKGVLDFGSSRRTDVGGGRRVASGDTPITPSFGILPLTTPGGSAHSLHPQLLPQHALSFSTITPSPAPLPTAYTKLLQSAPKSAGKRVMFQDTGCVSPMEFSLPPPAGMGTTDRAGLALDRSKFDSRMETTVGVEESGSGNIPPTPTHDDINSITSTTDTSELTNQIAPLLSRDLRSPPPLGATPPSMPPPRAPMKSAGPLRRSARLSGVGRTPSTSASAKRLSDLAIHSTRAKSRLKSPTSTRRVVETTGKKVGKVTFTTPLASRKTSQGHAHPTTPSPLSNHNSNASDVRHDSSPKENEVLMEEASGKVSASGSLELLTQQTVEQALMASITSLLHLLRQIGSAYQALCHYDLVRAIRLFRSLPPNQYHTPWVVGQIAKAYFAGEKFRECAKMFEEVHRMGPHRQQGMELYASALWHLKREVDLSVLAESLHSSAPLRPEGLCALASIMNLAKDHESAVKFLLRAVKICPSFTYAHTLLGHEYWVTKHYDKALSSFQSALTLDPRHYNAWYGMAHVYYAQEKYKFAETYASRALRINSSSSIACTQLALAQFHQNELDLALASLERAMTINSSNPIPRFHRARVLEALGRLEEALHQLEELTASWPKEPTLYITKGKILKKLNRPHEAVLQFSWALDFSRSGTSSQIREEIEQAYNPRDTLSGEEDDSYFIPHYDSEEEGEANEDSMQS